MASSFLRENYILYNEKEAYVYCEVDPYTDY